MTDKLLTPQEVADELRVSKRTVLRLITSDDLDAINLGHRTKRIRRSALDEYLSNKGAGK